MAQKPNIIYIESASWNMRPGNPYRDALSYFLRQHCGCEVSIYDYDTGFDKDFANAEQNLKNGRLICVIVKQEEYDDVHMRVIEKVRSGLSKTLPIVVIPAGWEKRFKPSAEYPLVYAYNYADAELVDLIKRLVAQWKPGLNWLGAQTTQEQSTLLDQLENAYRSNYLGDDNEGMAGTPDRNHMIVAEALRLKLLPSTLIKAEFDDTLVRRTSLSISDVAEQTKPSVYLDELEKIRVMSDERRMEFDHELHRAMGQEPAPGGGVYVTRASKGDNVQGFAIDPVTLETSISTGYGFHADAKDLLGYRIEMIDALSKGGNKAEPKEEDRYQSRGRIVEGLIFLGIKGFTTPIVRLYADGEDGETIKRIAHFLLGERRLIPVDYDGKLVE
jgi:hypothetical protein